MKTLSKGECDTLSQVAKSFSRNVMQISGKSREEALAAFRHNASMVEKIRLVASKVVYLFVPSTFYRLRARFLVRNCEEALPVLKRAFGEPALVEAMRAEPRRSDTLANTVERLGGTNIAALIRKSL